MNSLIRLSLLLLVVSMGLLSQPSVAGDICPNEIAQVDEVGAALEIELAANERLITRFEFVMTDQILAGGIMAWEDDMSGLTIGAQRDGRLVGFHPETGEQILTATYQPMQIIDLPNPLLGLSVNGPVIAAN